MNARELKQLFVSFFVSKNHVEIPSASLLPENDPTTLFISAGMHPLVPYLLGTPHPLGKRLTDVQKCLRTGDIDEVGDTYHHTFFEMLGNWSLGDYFKKEMIAFSYEFLTSKKYLAIDPRKLAVTVFAGDEHAPRDEDSAAFWLEQGILQDRIAYLPKKNNWWGPAGLTGPCGPDSEMFYWTGAGEAPQKFDPDDDRWLEIWNDVFMQYNKNPDGKYESLLQKNVDTGMGVERTTAILSGLSDNYMSSIWQPIIKKIEEISSRSYSDFENQSSMRVIADHLKASVFLIADGVEPSNKERGYVLRRLIRRAIRRGKAVGIEQNFCSIVAQAVLDNQDNYAGTYPELDLNKNKILELLNTEESKFRKTLNNGLKEIRNMIIHNQTLASRDLFMLYESFGFPYEMSIEEVEAQVMEDWKLFIEEKYPKSGEFALEDYLNKLSWLPMGKDAALKAFEFYKRYGIPVETFIEKLRNKYGFAYAFDDGLEKIKIEFENIKSEHQKQSQTLSAGKFKSGLADHSEIITKYHTATHLLHAALRKVLGNHVQQSGSNITAERLRFDFSHSYKLTSDQLKSVEDLVNQQISLKLPVTVESMKFTEAKNSGALAFFGAKYPEIVTVYTIGTSDHYFSKEVCTGPHVENTGILGKFEILKEESAGSGKRRIYAILK